MKKQNLRILLTVDPELPVPPGLYGGIERIVDALVRGLAGLGHSVTLCANKESEVPCELVPWPGMKSQRVKDTVRNAIALTNLVAKNKFDVLHSFSRLAYMTALMPFKVPKIMSYQREPSLSQIKKAVALARRHSLVFTGCSNYITHQIAQVAEAYTIYNCAPVEKYTFTENIGHDAPLIFLGRIENIKGAHVAVEVAKKCNKRLVIAGNIPAEGTDYFNNMVKPFLDDRITYVGAVNDEQKNKWLGKSAALLMPIQWNEPFGIVMAEAMACGTPVIGFKRGAVPEVVQDGISGYTCNSQQEMISAVMALEKIDRKAVRKDFDGRFSDSVIINQYLSLYNQLTQRV